MKHIARPDSDNYASLIDSFASSYVQLRTRERKERILSSIEALVCAGKSYNEHAAQGSLGNISESATCGVAQKDDLIDLYEAKMVRAKEGEPGRELYDKLRNGSSRGICPFCSQMQVTTLDHYLPKSTYSAYSIYPGNLIPSCLRCNMNKLAKSNGQILHPYYDDIENIEWLRCAIRRNHDSIVLNYSVNKDIDSLALQGRMNNHLIDLGIADLYQTSAILHLIDMRERLVALGHKGGASSVHEYLIEELNTRKCASLNSWSTALYTEICSCQWFINGGYTMIDAAQ